MLNNNRINQIDSFNKMHIHIQQLISLKPLFGQVETQQPLPQLAEKENKMNK